jgi:excisionase family DNA binding protein
VDATINNLIAEDEAATALGISKDTLFRLRKESKIRFYRIRNRVLFSPEQIKEFLANAEQPIGRSEDSQRSAA